MDPKTKLCEELAHKLFQGCRVMPGPVTWALILIQTGLTIWEVWKILRGRRTPEPM